MLPEKTAIEVKKNFAPGMMSILISDAEKALESASIGN
jgi:hypothetical protein